MCKSCACLTYALSQCIMWRVQDFDVLEDLDSRVMGDAWLWLPFNSRCMVLQIATDLAQLAVSKEDACKARLLCPATNPVLEPTPVYTSGVPQQHGDVHARQSCSNPVAASQVQLALHSMAQLLADSHETVCSPLLTALEIVNLGKTVTKPEESIFSTSHSFFGSSSGQTSGSIVSSTDSFDMFAEPAPVVAAERSLYMLLLRAYLAASKAVAVRDQSRQWVGDSARTLSRDTAVNIIDGPGQPTAQSKVPSDSVGFLPSLVLTTYSIARLFWVAVMGDVSFWHEAMHIMSGQKQGGSWAVVKRAILFAGLSALQLVAAASWVSTRLLRRTACCFLTKGDNA